MVTLQREIGRHDVNAVETATGSTALLYAAERGWNDGIILLIEHGADITHRNSVGDAIAWARRGEHYSTVELLQNIARKNENAAQKDRPADMAMSSFEELVRQQARSQLEARLAEAEETAVLLKSLAEFMRPPKVFVPNWSSPEPLYPGWDRPSNSYPRGREFYDDCCGRWNLGWSYVTTWFNTAKTGQRDHPAFVDPNDPGPNGDRPVLFVQNPVTDVHAELLELFHYKLSEQFGEYSIYCLDKNGVQNARQVANHWEPRHRKMCEYDYKLLRALLAWRLAVTGYAGERTNDVKYQWDTARKNGQAITRLFANSPPTLHVPDYIGITAEYRTKMEEKVLEVQQHVEMHFRRKREAEEKARRDVEEKDRQEAVERERLYQQILITPVEKWNRQQCLVWLQRFKEENDFEFDPAKIRGAGGVLKGLTLDALKEATGSAVEGEGIYNAIRELFHPSTPGATEEGVPEGASSLSSSWSKITE